MAAGVTVVDLSADFRLKDPAIYEKWYAPHTATDLLAQAAFGLPELTGDELAAAAERRAAGEAVLVGCAGLLPDGHLARCGARYPRGARGRGGAGGGRCRLGRDRRGQEGHRAHPLLLRQREPGGLRRGHPSPHPRDRADLRAGGPARVHSASCPAQPRTAVHGDAAAGFGGCPHYRGARGAVSRLLRGKPARVRHGRRRAAAHGVGGGNLPRPSGRGGTPRRA